MFVCLIQNMLRYPPARWNDLDVMAATVVVLLVFAVLVWWGITDSANVALVMFVAHCATLLMLIVASVVYVATPGNSKVRAYTCVCVCVCL